MDAQVPRNNAERRVHTRRPYRPRQPYPPRQLSQLELIQQHVMRMIQEQADQQREDSKKQVMDEIKGGAAPTPAKKSRRRYRMTFVQPSDADGNQAEKKVFITARDVATLLPTDKGVFVVFNPVESILKIKMKKESKKNNIETVAKARSNNLNNTLIFTTKYNKPSDLDKILEEIQQ